jgi:hypothetical protein
VEERMGSITVETLAKVSVTVTVTQAGVEATLTVLPDSRMVEAPAGTTTFDITSNSAWSVDESISWFSVDPLSGSGNDVLTVNFEENITGMLRWGTITVTANGGSPSVTVTVTQLPYPLHFITLPGGWTGLSSYLMPAGTDIDEIFNDIEEELVIVVTGGQFYYPETGVNTIGTWEPQSAYKIKTSEAVSLVINGMPEENKTLSLATGWNLIPVISDCSVDVAELFAPVAGDLTIVKEIAGYGIYWPAMGINTLSSVNPGNAYHVLVSDDMEITYGDCKNVTTHVNPVDFETLARMVPWNLTPPTPVSHAVAILPGAVSGMQKEGFYGAFDNQGHCFGVTPADKGATYLALFGNDPLTAEKDGFEQGEKIFFKYYDPSSGEVSDLIAEFDISLPDINGTFNENGLSAVTGFKVSGTGISENDPSAISLFPNPTSGKFTIRGVDKDAEVVIFTMQGQIVEAARTSSATEITLIPAAHETGVYMVKIITGNNTIFRKLVMK